MWQKQVKKSRNLALVSAIHTCPLLHFVSASGARVVANPPRRALMRGLRDAPSHLLRTANRPTPAIASNATEVGSGTGIVARNALLEPSCHTIPGVVKDRLTWDTGSVGVTQLNPPPVFETALKKVDVASAVES